MDFLYPLYLAGVLTAAVPIVIHLLTKRQKKHVLFADLTLLRKVDADEAPRYRWENLVLMLLRAAVCAALALMFCQPVRKAGGGSLFRPGQGTAAVIVIDSSRSMGASEGGVTRYEKAKQMALEFLGTLKGEDQAMVIFASSRPRASHDAPTSFREEVAEVLEQSEVTAYRSSFIPAVQLAVDALLASNEMANKELYLFTDCQRNGFLPAPDPSSWPPTADSISAYFGYLPDQSQMSPPNLEITDLSVTPVTAKAGEPVEVKANILAYGDEPPLSIGMYLVTGPKFNLFKEMNLVPGKPNPVQFSVVRTDEPVDTGKISLQADLLESDNTVHYAIPEARVYKVVMTHGGGGDKTMQFFQVALRFLAELPVIPKIEAEYVKLRDLPATLSAESVDVVFAANPARFDGTWVKSLTNYMAEGGNVVLAMGAVTPHQVNDLMVPNWFPAPIGKWETSEKEATSPIGFDFSHPWMDRFEKQEDADWQTVQVWGGYEFAKTEGTQFKTQNLMTLERGTPLLWQRDIGLGSLSVWMTSLDDKWNDAPRSGLYLALWGEFLRTLAERKGLSPSYNAGEQVPIEVIRHDDRPTEIHVIGPEGKKNVMAVAGPRLTQTGFFSKTDRVGVYTVDYNETKLERVTPSAFAVNVDPDEGDLTSLPVAEVERLFPFPIQKIETRGQLASQISYTRYGYGLWPYVFLLVLALVLGETWYGRPTT